MLHIVIDARMVHSSRDGAGTYLLELLPRMLELDRSIRYTLIVRTCRLETWRTLTPHAQLHAFDCGPVGLANQLLPILYLRQLRPDVYFFPGNTPPVLCPYKTVFTVHDLTPLTTPPYFERFSAIKTAIFRTLVGLGLRRAVKVIAVSNFTKSKILQYYGKKAAAKTMVVHHGPPVVTNRSFNGRNGPPCYLYVGTDRPHKNLDRLIEAYSASLRVNPDLPRLIIVGTLRRPVHYADLVRTRGLGEKILFLGYIEEPLLEELYENALALVFPSLSEGFGFPILEAMARGIPVITSCGSATCEVAGSAAILVDPRKTTSISQALELLASKEGSKLSSTLSRAGTLNLERFCWKRAAQETLSILVEASGTQ